MKELFKRKEKFSIRKFTIGIASVMIGASFIVGSEKEVKAEDVKTIQKNVEVHYVVESDLTDAEKATLKTFEENQVVDEDVEAYYYVYKAQEGNKTSVLPNTGNTPAKGVVVVGATLMVLALFVSKRKNKVLTVIAFAIGTSGLLGTTVLANNNFERFFENIKVSVGGKIPIPRQINGYTFTGHYFTKNREEIKTTELEKIDDTIKQVETEKSTKLQKITETTKEEVDKEIKQTEAEKTDITKPAESNKLDELEKDEETEKSESEKLVFTTQTEDEKQAQQENNPSIEVKETEVVTEIPFKTIEKDDPTIPQGQIRVIKEGIDGRKVTKERQFLNGSEVVYKETVVVENTLATDKVILIGTKPVFTVQSKDGNQLKQELNPTIEVKDIDKKEIEIPFETKTKKTATLYVGETKVEKTGIKGRKVIKERQFISDGKIQYTEEIVENIDPITEVILVGTKPVEGVRVETRKEEIPVSTKEEEDATKYVGDNEIQEGSVGEKEITTTYKTVKGKKTEEIISVEEKVIREPKDKIIKKGTKPIEATEEEKEMQVIKYTTRKENDDTLQKGKEEIKQQGVDGEKEITKIYKTIKGIRQENPAIEEKLIKDPIEEIIRVGTKEEQKINKEKLQVLSTEAEELNEDNYTAESYKILNEKLKEAKDILQNPDATQEQVDKVLKILQTAKDGLEVFVPLRKPILTVESVTPDDLGKAISLVYNLVDDNNSFQSSKIKVYSGDKLVKAVEFNPKNSTTVKLDNLDRDVTYTLVTEQTYTDGRKNNTEDIKDTRQVTLTLKKIQLADVISTEVYKVENGKTELVTGLVSKPIDLSNYYVKFKRKNHKDVLLPVSEITENNSNFDIKVISPQLVHVENNTFAEGIHIILDKVQTYPNAYTQFDKLIDAVKKNPAGTFEIGSNLVANTLGDSEQSYIANFTGVLESADDSKVFTISNLNKPLFNTLQNSTIKNINLNVNINTAKAAGLALKATNSNINNVHVKGDITATSELAGLVLTVEGNNSKLENISVEGNLSLDKKQLYENMVSGGVISVINGGTLTKVSTDIQYSVKGSSSFASKYVGGIVGQLGMNSTVNKAVAKGTINISGLATGASVGAIVGANAGVVSDGINEFSGNNSQSFGINSPFATPAKNINISEKVANNAKLTDAKVITNSEVEKLITEWQIKSTNSTSTNKEITTKYEIIDYTTLQNAQVGRKIAYENTSKLLPFYDQETIVKYGNKISNSSNLATKEIISIVSLSKGNVVNVTDKNTDEVDQIFVHYKDGTGEKINVKLLGSYQDTNVFEYDLGEGLLYTPEQFITPHNDIVNQVLQSYKVISFDSNEMHKAVNKPSDKKMEDLYWQSSFEEVKANINNYLNDLITNDIVLGNSEAINKSIIEKFISKKLQIITGLSYLSRLYDIKYGELSLKNIMLYNPNFYGQKQDVVSWLESIANLGYEVLKVNNNIDAYEKELAKMSETSNVISFSEKNRKLFLPNKQTNEWYKNSIKASVYEVKSKQLPNEDVSLYYWLSNQKHFNKYLLPLLNLRDDSMFITTNMSFVSFGIKDRYLEDKKLKTNNPTKYKEEIAKVEKLVQNYANRWASFVDMWYGIVDDSVKSKLVHSEISLFDGFQFGKNQEGWLSQYDKQYLAIEDFFGATGSWYGWANKGASAKSSYRTDMSYYTLMQYVEEELLSSGGAATLSHEFTHAMDQIALFDGYKRRPGHSGESFALGLLESSTNKNDYYYALNTIQNFEGELATHNQTNERFKSAQDLGDYIRGVFDVTYTLDAIEAESILKLSKSDQRNFFNKVSLVYDNSINDVTNARDKISEINSSEWNTMKLESIGDLVENNLVAVDKANYIVKEYVRDDSNYYFISLTSPIYSALQNNTGTVGGLQFRKTAWELLAEKGWKDGFIPYATDKLEKEAKIEGKVLSDEYIFNKIFKGEYVNYTEFKKKMYEKRIAKKEQLKPVTITWNNTTTTVDSYTKLKELIDRAVAMDNTEVKARRLFRYRAELKRELIKAYHKVTDDFKESVYKNQ
ncbi:YSIRK signal domain/LPXTG anchor domain surface protein [Gemella cuniculi]|uniref:YSIRK signal domain/LPXTG anchor domain surface protein n=1 Tax=Gemella cuniculi TaxID=150240 RepID=UPI0003FFF9CB|nr:YSIRK signal domain/LPXTG anchor domain surface protein [Gemella cuniculi]